MTLFALGVGIINYIVVQLSPSDSPRLRELKGALDALDIYVKKLETQAMDCSQSPCATVTGANLVKWPLSVPPPVTATCSADKSRQFIQVGSNWFERSDKPKSDFPSWLEAQKVEGIWPFQHRVSLKYLQREIEKACRG
ncbi:MAG: hypothetical protein HC940_06420 [Acaryochloris sp. SU_5_25]|nr:hypothetical protein [Acaryochloris sp. SU_5_25]